MLIFEGHKLKTAVFLLLGLLCWVGIACGLALLICQKRAQFAIENLREGLVRNVSYQKDLHSLDYISTWIRISSLLKGKGLSSDSVWLSNVSVLYDNLLKKSYRDLDTGDFRCSDCTESSRQNLKLIGIKFESLLQNKKRADYLSQLIEKLEPEIKQRIKMHVLLSLDFQDLIGSPSLYSSKGESEILYYITEPFKWLPILDLSKTKTNHPQEIPDYSDRLERLKSRSKSIVEEYLLLSGRKTAALEEIGTLETSMISAETEIKQLLISCLASEIQN